MDINNLLPYFKNVKRLKTNSYQATCPCHNDKKASLSITAQGDKILMHCHAGCATQNILNAVGLKMSDLSNREYIPPKKTWRDRMGNVEAVYNYGEYIKVRQKGKIIHYGRVENDTFVSGVPEGVEKTLYRLKELKTAISEGETVYYVEGEKDADNMRKIGLIATTAGSCSDWRRAFAKHFTGARVVILPDNDTPGQNLAKQVAEDIRDIAYSVTTVTVSDVEKGDVSDYLAEGGTRNSLLELVKAAPVKYAKWVRLNNGKPVGIYTDKLAYAIAHTMDYLIIKQEGLDVAEFRIFKDGVYKKCSKNEAKGYIKDYLPLGVATDTILNNVYNLLLCSNEKTYSFDEVNTNEGVINLQNGIVDLKEGQLKAHSAELLSTLQLNCNYNPKAECPLWLKYVDSLCSSADGVVDSEKVRLLQEWTGLLLSNVSVTRTKKCLVLTSPLGNTGKSVYLNVLGYFVGINNIANIPIQSMADRFALGDLYGKRLNLVGDQRSDDIADSSAFKQLTGGDSLKVELKGKQSFNWHFTGGIVMACNNLPAFTDDKGGHVFERLTIIPCERVIPMEERDGNLTNKLYGEAEGILNWALEGLYRLRNNGFKFSRCEASERITKAYRSRLDTFYGFIDEQYVITKVDSDRVTKKDLEEGYLSWCYKNDYNPLNKRNIKDRAERNGIRLIKSHGYYFYRGLVPKLFDSENVKEHLPKEFEQKKLF